MGCNNEGKNSDKKKYSLAMADVGFELLDLDGDGVAETPSFPVYQVVMETENMNYGYDIRGFTLCDAADDGPGGVCVWWHNDDELYDGTLSDNEAANFDNTDLIPTSLPFNLNGDAERALPLRAARRGHVPHLHLPARFGARLPDQAPPPPPMLLWLEQAGRPEPLRQDRRRLQPRPVRQLQPGQLQRV